MCHFDSAIRPKGSLVKTSVRMAESDFKANARRPTHSVHLWRFFHLTGRDWNDGDMNIHYAQAWSIAYFALKGSDKNFQKDYSKMFWELVKGRPVEEVVNEIFDDAKLDKYEEAWLKYWKNL